MTGEAGMIRYGEHEIAFSVIRRVRKTLGITVKPDSAVVVAAPMEASPEDIAARVRKRAAWVLRQQGAFGQYLPRTPGKRFVPGETHLFLGRQYRLKVVPDIRNDVTAVRGFFIVHSHHPKHPEITRELLTGWLRKQAMETFRKRLEKALALFPSPEDCRPYQVIVRDLKMRWGSMSPGRRLILNAKLIQAPVDTIDYVIVHELCHVLQPNHGPAFYDLLNRIMPDWRNRKVRLERLLF